MTTPTFTGEVMLAGWQESHTAGAKITFWLPDSDSLEVFKGMTAKKGNTAGQRFACVLVEIGDDDLPVQPEPTEKAKGGALARLAGMWCNDRRFYDFIRPIYDKHMGGNGAYHGDVELDDVGGISGFCRHAICVICNVDSRAELDHDANASEIFHRRIREPFAEILK